MMWIFLFVVYLAGTAAAALAVYPNITQTQNQVNATCFKALQGTIDCDPYLYNLAATDYFGSLGSNSVADSVCKPACGTSLANFHNSVQSSCKGQPAPWDGVPGIWAGDLLWATYNRTCTKDAKTGQYCSEYVEAISANLTAGKDASILSLSDSQLCSSCMIQLLSAAQSTSFSNYALAHVADWKAVQSRCKLNLPTTVQPPITNVTRIPGYADSSANRTCASGQYYTVQTGDDCGKIANSQKVATAPLRLINNILPDCTNLILGAKICLPQACTIYTVKSGDTCVSIAQAYGLTVSGFVGYNPSLNSACTNLIANTNVCVSPPGGSFTASTIPGASVTRTDQYATTTVTPPTPTPYGTTPYCGKFYNVTSGDTCQQISLNKGITVSLFQQINPSVNQGCTNLAPGYFYCILPMESWNATATNTSSTTVAPPGPTESGTTSQCYKWHVVQSGNTCYDLQQLYGITLDQLRYWNPSIKADCSNLILNDAYCVKGPALPSTTATSTPTGTGKTTTTSPTTSTKPTTTTSTSTKPVTTTSTKPVTTPTPTQSGMATGCTKFYYADGSIYCYDIAQKYGITVDTFVSWNPAVKSDCSGLFKGYYYCVSRS